MIFPPSKILFYYVANYDKLDIVPSLEKEHYKNIIKVTGRAAVVPQKSA
jgi:hypothetical protein